MSELVTAITTGITIDKLMAQITTIAPVVIMSVLFAFGWRIFRKSVKGVSRGKASI